MTDWGVHLVDPLHQCFDEVMPLAISAMGSKFYVKDNVDTPDTMLATFQYPKFIASYESRTCNPMPLLDRQGAGTSVHGTEGTLIVTRSGCWVTKNRPTSTATPVTLERDREMGQMNVPHWRNFLECIKSRQKPTSDIETCVRSTTTCLLANVSMRSKTRLDWNEKEWTVSQKEAKPYLKARYRKPWKLEV
jgi:predicted dehydrogenase